MNSMMQAKPISWKPEPTPSNTPLKIICGMLCPVAPTMVPMNAMTAPQSMK